MYIETLVAPFLGAIFTMLMSNADSKKPSSPPSKVLRYRSKVALEASMIHFLATVRNVDTWRLQQVKQNASLYEAYEQMSLSFQKSPLSKSNDVEDLEAYLEMDELDINFMMRLPSIVQITNEWWREFTGGEDRLSMACLEFKNFYANLAGAMVEASTEHKKQVFVDRILLSDWLDWNPTKCREISKEDFARQLFVLAHLETTTCNIGDYIVYLKNTLEKVQAEQKRKKEMKHIDNMRRAVLQNVRKKDAQRISPTRETRKAHHSASDGSATKPERHIVSANGVSEEEGIFGTLKDGETIVSVDISANLLKYRPGGMSQNISVDPLLLDANFQQKFQPHVEAIKETKPRGRRYIPPMHISRINYSKQKSSLNKMTSSPSLGKLHDESTDRVEADASKLSQFLLKSESAKQLPSLRKEPTKATSNKSQTHNFLDHSSKDGAHFKSILRRNQSRPGVLHRIQGNEVASQHSTRNNSSASEKKVSLPPEPHSLTSSFLIIKQS